MRSGENDLCVRDEREKGADNFNSSFGSLGLL